MHARMHTQTHTLFKQLQLLHANQVREVPLQAAKPDGREVLLQPAAAAGDTSEQKDTFPIPNLLNALLCKLLTLISFHVQILRLKNLYGITHDLHVMLNDSIKGL